MISAENLTKQKFFKDLSFSFDDGIMGIVSPSETDKGALISAICGISVTTSGTLNSECEEIGYVAKGAPLPKTLTVNEYIGFVMNAKGNSYLPEELNEKLSGITNRRISSLTNLQRYKVAIITELIGEPNVLILESPSFTLSFDDADDIFTFIEEISEETPIIFSGERFSEIRKYADTALVLLNGKQLFFGTTQELENQSEAEGILTVKVKGNEEAIKSIFEKYNAEIMQSARKGTFKCVMSVPESEKAEIKNAITTSGLALLEMKAEGDDLKKLIAALDENENALRLSYEEEKAEKQIKTLNQLKLEQLNFSHNEENIFETEDDDEAPAKAPSRTLSEEEKENKRRALFGYSDDDDEDDDDGESTLFSSKN